jgi:fatty-acyl-CoA synthase
LVEHLRGSFPKWWLPDRITITDDLPRTPVGKIDKASLRRDQDLTPDHHTSDHNSEEVA